MAKIHPEVGNFPEKERQSEDLITAIEAVFDALNEPFEVDLSFRRWEPGGLEAEFESNSISARLDSFGKVVSQLEELTEETTKWWPYPSRQLFKKRLARASSQETTSPENVVLHLLPEASADPGWWREISYEKAREIICLYCDPRSKDTYFGLAVESPFHPLLIQFPKKEYHDYPQPEIFVPNVKISLVMSRKDNECVQKVVAAVRPFLEPIWHQWLERQLSRNDLLGSHKEIIKEEFEKALSSLKFLL